MLKAIREIRSNRVVVYHPKDRERDELIAHIRRIGCEVEAIWPPRESIKEDADVIFMLFREDGCTQSLLKALAERDCQATLIAMVEFESPKVMEAVVRAGVASIVTKPIRAFGLLTSLVLARTITAREKNLLDRVRKLEDKLDGLRRLEKAKAILISRKGVSEQQAYDSIRMRAMSARVSIDVVCSSIIGADELNGL
ncbi:ANTAR domain-containing response regulator [Methylobacterium sp. R2-1]|uniref:ANTAR domain-containing response regulator n=1 Tax=Methylobacterium sp. R2-1 TaxID=2587064 RepID=UPI00161736A5|nr:ANTAR domain-containing protein [Methylobacterium sp. R2-1]MBB2965017.1 AmiR/NasT family two-component response regulator [Methylobacterium sp. R2-1]